jgi:hypothetical protein
VCEPGRRPDGVTARNVPCATKGNRSAPRVRDSVSGGGGGIRALDADGMEWDAVYGVPGLVPTTPYNN